MVLLRGAVLFPLGVLLETWDRGMGPQAVAVVGSALVILGLCGAALGICARRFVVWQISSQCPPIESRTFPYCAPHESVISCRISQSSGKNRTRNPSFSISTDRPFNDFEPIPMVR